MTITRAQFPLLLEPKLRNISNDGWKTWALLYTSFVNIGSSKKAQETDYQMTGLGSASAINEDGDVAYDTPISGSTKVYTHATNGLGYKITPEMVRHEQYGQMTKMEKSLTRALIDKQEVDATSVLNNAFSTSYTGFTAAESLCSTSHARLDGGTANSNRPATDINLGVTALQNAIIQFRLWKDDRGRPIRETPRKLIIHPNDIMTARELLGTTLKPGTANNDINAIREDGLSFMDTPYITSTNDWFLFGADHDLWFIWDLRPTYTMDEDFDSDRIKRKAKQAYSFGFGSYIGVYGTSGTA
ncbi:MAG: hypothetical protein V2A73_01625 [Pseudomonadota bacterium]